MLNLIKVLIIFSVVLYLTCVENWMKIYDMLIVEVNI